MQKKLIALAIASAISAPAFADNANFTFYGIADVSYDSVNTGNGTTTANGATVVTGVTKQVVSSNVSRFGFKGSEDLGDGLNAIWQVEQQINIDDAASNTFASRNTFAGLKGDFGTVLMGRHDTPYKISTRKLDVFADNIADDRALLGTSKGTGGGWDQRLNNVLAYISPSLGGATVALATANLTEANTTNTAAKNSAVSLAAWYDVAPFYVAAAYESHKLESVVAGGKESAARVGFGFNQDLFEIGAAYEKTSDNLGTGANLGVNQYGRGAYYVGGKVKFGGDAVKFAYGKVGEYGTGNLKVTDSGASQASVGYDHGFSKRTKVYVLYTRITNGKGVNYQFSQNSGAASTTSGFGTSPSAISLGLKHTF